MCLSFYGKELLAPHPTHKLEDHPLPPLRDCLFNIFAATLNIWRPFLHPHPEDAPQCWQGLTHYEQNYAKRINTLSEVNCFLVFKCDVFFLGLSTFTFVNIYTKCICMHTHTLLILHAHSIVFKIFLSGKWVTVPGDLLCCIAREYAGTIFLLSVRRWC